MLYHLLFGICAGIDTRKRELLLTNKLKHLSARPSTLTFYSSRVGFFFSADHKAHSRLHYFGRYIHHFCLSRNCTVTKIHKTVFSSKIFLDLQTIFDVKITDFLVTTQLHLTFRTKKLHLFIGYKSIFVPKCMASNPRGR